MFAVLAACLAALEVLVGLLKRQGWLIKDNVANGDFDKFGLLKIMVRMVTRK